MAHDKPKSTIFDRKIALGQILIVAHKLKLTNLKGKFHKGDFYLEIEWAAGKYAPQEKEQ